MVAPHLCREQQRLKQFPHCPASAPRSLTATLRWALPVGAVAEQSGSWHWQHSQIRHFQTENAVPEQGRHYFNLCVPLESALLQFQSLIHCHLNHGSHLAGYSPLCFVERKRKILQQKEPEITHLWSGLSPLLPMAGWGSHTCAVPGQTPVWVLWTPLPLAEHFPEVSSQCLTGPGWARASSQGHGAVVAKCAIAFST